MVPSCSACDPNARQHSQQKLSTVAENGEDYTFLNRLTGKSSKYRKLLYMFREHTITCFIIPRKACRFYALFVNKNIIPYYDNRSSSMPTAVRKHKNLWPAASHSIRVLVFPDQEKAAETTRILVMCIKREVLPVKPVRGEKVDRCVKR